MKPRHIVALLSLLSLLTACSTPPTVTPPPTTGAKEEPASITTLEGTSWALVRMRDSALVLPPNTRRPFLAFTPDGRLHGYTGINRLSGQPEVSGHEIRFGQLGTTRMAGPTEAMAIEDRLLECLQLANNWRINDGRLELLGDDQVLAIFNPIASEELD